MNVVPLNYIGVGPFFSSNDLVALVTAQRITHMFCSDAGVNTCDANPTKTQPISDHITGLCIYCTVLSIVIFRVFSSYKIQVRCETVCCVI